jgi:NADH dehydrogenase
MFLLAGATSSPGRLATQALLAKGQRVRVLVRSEKDETAFAELGAEVVRGDIRDAASVATACRGASTVISMIGRHFAETREGLWAIDAVGNEALIAAAKAAGVRRFVLLSALFADRDYPPVLLGAKRRAEEALVASKLDHAIIRPSTFTAGASSLVGAVGPSIERWGIAFVPKTKPISFVALVDVADALVAAALDSHPARVVDLGGPEALTLAEGAQRLASVLKKRVRLVPIPRRVVSLLRQRNRRRFGAYELLLFTEMLCDHGYACDPGPARQLLGREPTAVDVELAEYYARTTLTPWRESNIGVIRSKSR